MAQQQADWRHHTAQIGDLRTHWVEAGSGPLVLLLHGFPETWFAWRHQIPALAEHYRVVAPDLRGYGSTDKPMDGYDKRTCNDYRAGQADVKQDEEDADVRIGCPTLVLWGEDFELVGKMWDLRGIWSDMANDVSFAPIAQCGHLPHEERPDEVNARLLKFLRR